MNAQTPVTCRPKDPQAVFGISRPTLYRWMKAGHIRRFKRGRMTFGMVADVQAYIQSASECGTQCGAENRKRGISQ